MTRAAPRLHAGRDPRRAGDRRGRARRRHARARAIGRQRDGAEGAHARAVGRAEPARRRADRDALARARHATTARPRRRARASCGGETSRPRPIRAFRRIDIVVARAATRPTTRSRASSASSATRSRGVNAHAPPCARLHADRGAARARDLRRRRACSRYRATAAMTDGEARLSAEAQRWRTLEALFTRFEADIRAGRAARVARGRAASSPHGSATRDSAGNAALRLHARRLGVRRRARHRAGSASAIACATATRRTRVLAATRSMPATRAPTVYPLVSGVAAFRSSTSTRDGTGATAGRCSARPTCRARCASSSTLADGDAHRAHVRAAMKMPRDRRGAALILAMLVAALAATVAVALAADQQRWLADVGNRARPGAGAGARARRRAVGAADPAGRRARGTRRPPRRAVGVPAAADADRERLDRRPHRGRAGPAQSQQRWRTTARGATPSGRASRACSRAKGVDPRMLDAIADWVDADGVARRTARRTRGTRSASHGARRGTRRSCARRNSPRCAARARKRGPRSLPTSPRCRAGRRSTSTPRPPRCSRPPIPGSCRRQARGVHRRARAQAVHDDGRAARAPAARRHAPEGAPSRSRAAISSCHRRRARATRRAGARAAQARRPRGPPSSGRRSNDASRAACADDASASSSHVRTARPAARSA